MGYREGGNGTDGSGLSDGSRYPTGLFDPSDGEIRLLGGLATPDTGELALSGSAVLSDWFEAAAAAASCSRRKYLHGTIMRSPRHSPG